MVIVGGGRWGRVWLSVVRSAFGDGPTCHVVSKTAADSAASSLGGLPRYHASLDAMPDLGAGTPCIIANGDADHVAAARIALDRKWHVLVEKPVALTGDEIAAICAEFEHAGLVLFPGHTPLFAPYLHEFARAAWSLRNQANGFAIDWHDPVSETRHGVQKTRNLATPFVKDVWPHLDAISQTVLGAPLGLTGDPITEDGPATVFRVSAGTLSGTVSIASEAQRRLRAVRLQGQAGGATLDFTVEPGSAFVEGVAIDLAASWSRWPSPLRLLLGCFLSAIAQAPDLSALHGIATGAGHMADRAWGALKSDHGASISAYLRTGRGDHQAVVAKLSEVALPMLVTKGADPRSPVQIHQAAGDLLDQLVAGTSPVSLREIIHPTDQPPLSASGILE